MGTLEGFPNPPAMVRGERSSPAPHAWPWSDGTSSVELAPLALIARLAALVPPPRRHLTGYFGVLSSHSSLRSQCVPAPMPESPDEEDKSPRTLPLSHYISWSQLLRRTFEIDTICPRCKSPHRLIASSRPRTPSRRSWPAWVCRPKHPNPIPRDLLPLNLVRAGTTSTDGTSTRAGWSTLPCVFETAPSGARNGDKGRPRALRARDQGRAAAVRQNSPSLKKPLRKNYGPVP